MSLPTDDKARKALPVFRGPLMYFPDAFAELARVCQIGNDQHNLGEQMHWARGKSMEQMDTALRHMMDHGTGAIRDTDGAYHMAKAAWRCLAELQLQIERDRAAVVAPHQQLDLPLEQPAQAPTRVRIGDMVSVEMLLDEVRVAPRVVRVGDRVHCYGREGVVTEAGTKRVHTVRWERYRDGMQDGDRELPHTAGPYEFSDLEVIS